jgi:hypothetical protein
LAQAIGSTAAAVVPFESDMHDLSGAGHQAIGHRTCRRVADDGDAGGNAVLQQAGQGPEGDDT